MRVVRMLGLYFCWKKGLFLNNRDYILNTITPRKKVTCLKARLFIGFFEPPWSVPFLLIMVILRQNQTHKKKHSNFQTFKLSGYPKFPKLNSSKFHTASPPVLKVNKYKFDIFLVLSNSISSRPKKNLLAALIFFIVKNSSYLLHFLSALKNDGRRTCIRLKHMAIRAIPSSR